MRLQRELLDWLLSMDAAVGAAGSRKARVLPDSLDAAMDALRPTELQAFVEVSAWCTAVSQAASDLGAVTVAACLPVRRLQC